MIETIIELTPLSDSNMFEGKIRINSKHISAYFRERQDVLIDHSKTETYYKTAVYIFDKLFFYVQETPEEIDKMIKKPMVLPPRIDRGDPTEIKED